MCHLFTRYGWKYQYVFRRLADKMILVAVFLRRLGSKGLELDHIMTDFIFIYAVGPFYLFQAGWYFLMNRDRAGNE